MTRRQGLAIAVLVLLPCLAGIARAANLSPSDTALWTGPFGQGFDDVQGVAVDPTGQVVYVADTYYVYEYDSAGVFIRFWGGKGTGPGQFDHASGITVDPFGDVYVADSGNGRVEHFDEDGKFVAEWPIPGARKVAADSTGTIYVLVNLLLSPYPLVTARTDTGAELRTWPAQFPDDFGPSEYYTAHYLASGAALTTDAAGNVIVVGRSFQHFQQPDDDTCARQVWDYQPQYDQRPLADPLKSGEIVQFSAQGVVQARGWLSRYPFSCASVSISDGDARGVAVDPSDGSFFVAMAEHFVRRVPNTPPYLANDGELGIPCLICSGQPSNFGTPSDLAFDCRANLYVASYDKILKYRNAGAPPPPCGTKRKHFEIALGPTVRRSPGEDDKLLVTVGCTGDACKGVVKVTGTKPGCKRCRPLVAKQHFAVPGDSPEALELTVRKAALPLLGDGPISLRLAARARAPHGPARSVVVPATMLLDATALGLACPATATAGTPTAASGTIGPARATAVDVHVDAPDGTSTAFGASSDASGHFDVGLLPDRAGTWTVRAGWGGDPTHDPGTATCAFTADEPPPVVTVACPGTGMIGSPLAATGSVAPALADGQGGIEFGAPSGGLIVVPGGDGPGMLAGSLVPMEAGTWTLRGRWTSVGGQVTASSPCTVDVQRLASTLTLTCPSAMPLDFTGALVPARAGEVVTITYTSTLGGPPVQRTATTAADGSFSDTLPAGTINSGSAQASWPGDATYAPATSASCGF